MPIGLSDSQMSDVIARAHGAARIAVRVYLNVVAALLRALNREIGDADVHCAAVAYVRRLANAFPYL